MAYVVDLSFNLNANVIKITCTVKYRFKDLIKLPVSERRISPIKSEIVGVNVP